MSESVFIAKQTVMNVQSETAGPTSASRRLGMLCLAVLTLAAACAPRARTPEQQLAHAEAALARGDTAAAILALDTLAASHPQRVDILEALGFAQSGAGNHVAAAFAFVQAAEAAPSRPDYRLYAAGAFLATGDQGAAVQQYRHYLKAAPDNTAIWTSLAELEQERGNRGGALEAWLAAERRDRQPRHQLAIGRLYLAANNLPQAQEWFARAHAGPAASRADALLGLLETALRASRTADAEQLLGELDAIHPDHLDQSHLAPARAQLAAWRARQDELAATAAALDRAAAAPAPTPAEPPAGEPATPAAAAAPHAAEPGEKDLEAAAGDAAPPPPPPEPDLVQQAHAAASAGQWLAATDLYRQALVADPSAAATWLAFSEAAFQAGQSDWARAAANEARRQAPGNPRPAWQFLRVTRDLLPPSEWLREAHAAYREHAQDPDIILTLARGYLQIDNNRRHAGILFQRFLDLAPADHPERAQVGEELRAL